MGFLETLGRFALVTLEFHGRCISLLGLTARGLVRRPFDGRAIATQVVRVGVEGLPVVLLTAVFTGAVLALQTFTGFQRFPAEAFVGAVVSLSMLRALAPVLTGLMIAGRSGSLRSCGFASWAARSSSRSSTCVSGL